MRGRFVDATWLLLESNAKDDEVEAIGNEEVGIEEARVKPV